MSASDIIILVSAAVSVVGMLISACCLLAIIIKEI